MKKSERITIYAVLRIRIGFNAGPDTDPDPEILSMRIRLWIRIQTKSFDDQKF